MAEDSGRCSVEQLKLHTAGLAILASCLGRGALCLQYAAMPRKPSTERDHKVLWGVAADADVMDQDVLVWHSAMSCS